jgi:selenocysteine lyase/cysteine desulfurase
MKNMGQRRNLFSIPENVHYFNVAGISPLLNSVVHAGERGVRLKASPWLIGDDHFFNNLETARELFAQLIQASKDDIAIVPSATYGAETACKNLMLQPGDEVVVQAEEFPALVLPLSRLCEKSQSRLVTVPRPHDFDWKAAVLKAMAARTKVLAVSPCHWTDGTILDLEVVTKRARELGAVVIIDGCQWLGARPFDVRTTRPDYLLAPTYKWLMGPYTFGFLYVAPHLQSGEPLEEYWASRHGANDFARLTDYESKYQLGARRFDMSERSQFVNLPMAVQALEQVLAWGPENVSKELNVITDTIASGAIKKGYFVAPEEYRSPHFIGIKRPSGFSEDFKNQLVAKNIHVGYRGEWMRISPHLHITERDIDELLKAL